MLYSITISSHNKQPHLDIESEIQTQKDGLFTFVVRVVDTNIVDVVYHSYESFKPKKH